VPARFTRPVEDPPVAALVRCSFSGDAAWEFAAGDDVLRSAVEAGNLVLLDRSPVEVLAGPVALTHLVFPTEPSRELRTAGPARATVLAR
jgi:hypothetical protein